MASSSAGEIGRQLGRLFSAGSAVGLTDGELIERFTGRRGESAEGAFETILARHGGLVWNVCRQVLGDAHAAEDAFQATFLVLVRRAASLRVRQQGSLGPWLYGVAYRIALKARQGAARRRTRERRVAKTAVETASDAIEHDELQALLHDEVNRLPAKYRAPVVLCYFEGRTHEEAAAVLQWPLGTVRSKLSRARDRLRIRLTRRGLARTGSMAVSALETIAQAEVEIPAALRTATVAAAIQGTPAAIVASLAKTMLRSLLMARVKMPVAALAIVLTAAGLGLALRDSLASQPPRRPEPDPVTAHPKADDASRKVLTNAKPKPAAKRSILIRVVGPDGKPMAGVNVGRSVWTRKPGNNRHVGRVTDERGEVRLDVPETLYIFRLWARTKGYVPLFAHWEEEDDPEETLPEEFTFRLQRGTVIGGIIRDQAGQPIQGATVEVSLDTRGKSEPRVGPDYWLAQGNAAPTTDAQGRWSLDNVPPGDGVKMNLKITHRGYISDPEWGTLQKEQGVEMPALRARTATITMKGGLSVTGTVTDPEGRTVAGAVVVWGEDPYMQSGSQEVRTNAHGIYILPPLPRGPMTITAIAPGWMPMQKKIDLQPGLKPVDFPLDPGEELRIRFVDRLGQPIPGVYVSIAKWRGNQALYNHRHPNVLDTQIPNQAGDAGLYQWTWAPDDGVSYTFGKEGYQSRDATLVADGKEQTITLQAILRITGKVTDAVTGRPIEKVTAIPVADHSYGRLLVERQHKKVFPGGVYAIEGDAHRTDVTYRVRIEVEGYRTAMSDALLAGRRTFDFRLEPAPPVRGRVVDAQGQPVAGARVYLATASQILGIENQDEDGWPSNQKVATDSQGAFSFPAQFERYAVIVRHNTAGYAEVSLEPDQQPGNLALRAWAHLEGRLMEAGRPVPSVWIHFTPLRPRSAGSPHIQDGISVETDRAGRFVFPRTPPVKSSVRAQISVFRESPIRSSRSVPLDPQPGRRIELDLGGAGASVTGRVVLSGAATTKVDLHQSINYLIRREPGIEPPAELRSLGFDILRGWSPIWAGTLEGFAYLETLNYHSFTLDRDGRFEINGVPAGDYDLVTTLYQPPVEGCLIHTAGSKIVRVRVTEESARKGTLDLGTIEVEAMFGPRPGEVVPDLAFTASSGQTVKLSDFRGRYVLLDFWATWCGRCVADLPEVRKLHETYGADKRLAILGLNLDDDPAKARRFVTDHPLPWTQGSLGGRTDDPVLSRYAVNVVPAYFLIGPDGKLIRSSQRVEEIGEVLHRSPR